MSESDKKVRINWISIKNYKGIDSLEIEFPRPFLEGYPDILVVGSENGVGKSSLLECCAIFLFCQNFRILDSNNEHADSRFEIPYSLIRAGEDKMVIEGEIEAGDNLNKMSLSIGRDGLISVSHTQISGKESLSFLGIERADFISVVRAICGYSPNPVLKDSFLYIHSYRKILEINPIMGRIVKDFSDMRQEEFYFENHPFSASSHFKMLLLWLKMDQAKLFEEAGNVNPESSLLKLDWLAKKFSGGKFGKLAQLPRNKIGFQIILNDGKDPVPLDGLSSGQKDMLSMQFLIWYHTREKPKVVLIDEPELHLNAQWHRVLMNELLELTPENQFIIATHSEGVADSVDKRNRLLLSKAPN